MVNTNVAVKEDTAKPAFHLIDAEFMAGVIDTTWDHEYECPLQYLNKWRSPRTHGEFANIGYVFQCVVGMYGTDNPKHVARAELARVLNFGATKYAPNNWRKGFDWSRLWRATYGHIESYRSGQLYDPETGFCHLSHALCMLMFLYVHQRDGLGIDDRAEVWPQAAVVPAPVPAGELLFRAKL